MISFSVFPERRIIDNIVNWLKDVLAEYNIGTSEYTVITDCRSSTISLKQYHMLVVSFYIGTHHDNNIINQSKQ